MYQDLLDEKKARFTERIRENWRLLTEEDLQTAQGRRQIISQKIQQRYGIAKEAAEVQLDRFMETMYKVKAA